MARKNKDFQLEIRLGLALIVLVLLTMNFASHYTLYRIKQSVEVQTNDQLYEATIKAANLLQRDGNSALSSRAFKEIQLDYGLERLMVLDWNLKRIKNLNDHRMLDSELQAIDSGLSSEVLLPLLINRPVFYHKSGGKNSLVLFPSKPGEDSRIIVALKSSHLLATLENSGRILLYVGLLGIMIIIYATFKFSRYIISPFKSLKDKAVKAGRLDQSGADDVSRLIYSYGNIINDLKQKEKELRQLNEMITQRADNLEVYNNYVLRSINTGVVTLDTDQNISTMNKAAEGIFGKNADAYNGLNCRAAFDICPELPDIIEQFYNNGVSISNHQVTISGSEQTELILTVSISNLTDSRGNRIGSCLILNDQTEFIRMREELDLKTRMATLGEMSGGLAHQLRNSIAAIVGFARIITNKCGNNLYIIKNIDCLLKESLEAESLVARFLDFARPLEISSDWLDLVGLLNNIISAANEKYTDVKIRIDTDEFTETFITGDQLLLKQAIGNIIDNACFAVTAENGHVEIVVVRSERDVEIRISDDGQGIPADYKDKIFTPFFSGSPSGTGLGLPLARKITNLHEGSLTFKSTWGQGTTFILRLPQPVSNKICAVSRSESTIPS